ncbi:MAG: DUF554 domain-containing protein [Halanaerobiales bacterium]|nr:DUF554 domain-containing protein [Halanaerobiales bacterium]
MSGTLVNFLAIIAGGLVGIFFKNRLSAKIQLTIIQGLSLVVILIGLQMALQTDNLLILLFSLVGGGISGELLKIENRLAKLGEKIKKDFQQDNSLFVQGFVQATLVFCVGAMAVMGAIQDGINNDPTILYNKAVLDGIAAVAFSASLGMGVIFSAIPVLVYQGGITILASWVEQFLTQAMITQMTATGGLLIIALGLNMLKITTIRVGNLLPALLLAILLSIF